MEVCAMVGSGTCDVCVLSCVVQVVGSEKLCVG
jgi:hypothetical protein